MPQVRKIITVGWKFHRTRQELGRPARRQQPLPVISLKDLPFSEPFGLRRHRNSGHDEETNVAAMVTRLSTNTSAEQAADGTDVFAASPSSGVVGPSICLIVISCMTSRSPAIPSCPNIALVSSFLAAFLFH